ncbi:MAG: hypothetical protein ACP5SJ_02890 [Candidatus Micrarchaeia archaeon]
MQEIKLDAGGSYYKHAIDKYYPKYSQDRWKAKAYARPREENSEQKKFKRIARLLLAFNIAASAALIFIAIMVFS